eukprot:5058697-Pleurochrysis_carterae.AAC.3
MESSEEYLERTQLRALLESIYEDVCREKPDKVAPYLVEWLLRKDPEIAGDFAEQAAQLGTWIRTDMPPTRDALVTYLQDLMIRPKLEAILEAVMREQPQNHMAFMVDYVCKTTEA